MRLLMIHERYRQRGGEDRAFDTETAMLEARGCQVERLVVDNADIDERRGGLALAVNAAWSQSGRERVREAVRRFRPHLAHIHNWFPLLSPSIHSAIRAQGVPVVQTLHNFRLLCLNGLMFREGGLCEDCREDRLKWRGVLRRCYREDTKASAAVAAMILLHRGLGTWRRQVDLFLAFSEFSRQYFIAGGLPADRIAIKPNAVPDPGSDAASWRRPRSGAVFIGRLSPEKGIAELLRAWHGVDHRLTVVGEGPLAEPLRAMAPPQVEFTGWCRPEAISAILSEAALVCVPSRCHEQGPLVVAEAAAHGVPVLASDLGALRRLVIPGETGVLLPPPEPGRDPLVWRSEAIRLLRSLELLSTLGGRAREVYLERYSPDAVMDQLLACYARAGGGQFQIPLRGA
ncbi:MAG: glycosyltransferase family 4 protein [Alphaproteobacteria bacterium]